MVFFSAYFNRNLLVSVAVQFGAINCPEERVGERTIARIWRPRCDLAPTITEDMLFEDTVKEVRTYINSKMSWLVIYCLSSWHFCWRFDDFFCFTFNGTIKLPLYELLRQQSPLVKRAKEVDVGAPDGPSVRGAFAVIMQNQGETERVMTK